MDTRSYLIEINDRCPMCTNPITLYDGKNAHCMFCDNFSFFADDQNNLTTIRCRKDQLIYYFNIPQNILFVFRDGILEFKTHNLEIKYTYFYSNESVSKIINRVKGIMIIK